MSLQSETYQEPQRFHNKRKAETIFLWSQSLETWFIVFVLSRTHKETTEKPLLRK